MIATRLLALPLILSVLSGSARGATTTIAATKDNSIYQSAPQNSAGGAAGIFVGTNGAGSPRRGLLAFDIAASVPAGATITSAELTLYLGIANNTSMQTIGLHRLTADWGEGTAGSSSSAVGGAGNGFAAAAGDATWNERMFGSAPWTSPGAAGDFTPAASAVALVGGANDTPHTWLSTPALVSDLQAWLDHPANNFGWALVNANETVSQSVKVFYSRSATQNSTGGPLDPSRRPQLTVTYVIPEPSALVLALLLCCCCCCIIR